MESAKHRSMKRTWSHTRGLIALGVVFCLLTPCARVVPVGPITVYVQLYTVHGWQTLPECVLSICQPGLELRLRYGTGLRHGMRHFDKQQSASAECICRLQVDQRNEYRVRALGLAQVAVEVRSRCVYVQSMDVWMYGCMDVWTYGLMSYMVCTLCNTHRPRDGTRTEHSWKIGSNGGVSGKCGVLCSRSGVGDALVHASGSWSSDIGER